MPQTTGSSCRSLAEYRRTADAGELEGPQTRGGRAREFERSSGCRVNYSRNEYMLLALAGFGHFNTHLLELMFPTAAIAIAADSGMPLAHVTGLSFAGYLLFGLGALPAGIMTDRFGCRPVLLGSLALASLFALATGAAAPGWQLALTLAGMGAALSAYHPAGMSLLSRGVRARGRALGINGMCGNLGVGAAPIVTATLQASWLGWRGTYLAVGAVSLTIVFLFSLLRIEEPLREDGGSAAKHDATDGGSPWYLFAFLCLAATLAGIIYRSNTIILPAYFSERVTIVSYGVATSLAYVVGVPAQYLGGALADRHELRLLYVFAHASTFALLLLMPLLTQASLVGTGAAVVLFSLGMQPIENSLFAKLTPARWRATGYGIKFVLTFGLGAAGVAIVERAQAKGDLSLAFLWLGGIALAMVLSASCLIIFGRSQLFNCAPQAAGEPPLHRAD